MPFEWILRGSEFDDLAQGPVALIPAIGFPDDQGSYDDVMIDSSPQITRLEALQTERSLIPPDPASAFIDFLIEDFGDEWVTKQMYHYRWHYADAVIKAGRLLPLDIQAQIDDETLAHRTAWITDRQKGRRALVGSTEQNRPVIEDSYRRLLQILEERFRRSPYLLGDRPGRGDFGLFGQLRQLVGWDPESARIAIDLAPRVTNWVERTDDLSWLPIDGDSGWGSWGEIVRDLTPLLTEIGSTYAPFMLANATALAQGDGDVECEILGMAYSQGAFAYQAKCLTWIREQYGALDRADQIRVDEALAGTGCEVLIA